MTVAPFLSLQEMNILMDISFLFQSVRDLTVMSQKFLQMLGKIVPYEKAAVFLYQENRRQFSSCAEVRCGGGMVRDYTDNYCNLDYLGWQIFQSADKVFRESDMIRPEERVTSRFYREYLRRYDAEYRLVLSGRSSSGDLLGMVMLFRSDIFEDFSDQEVAILEMLYNHFSAGIENAIHLDLLSVRANMAQKVYKSILDVMIILDETLAVQEGNEAAEQFLARLEDTPDQQREFFRTIRSCCREMAEEGAFSEAPSSLPDYRQISIWDGVAKISMVSHADVRGKTLRQFVVVFSPKTASDQLQKAPAEPTVEENRQRFFSTLSRQYGLTKRELNLIELALEGLENQKIADTLHISLFTVKSHFQNGYAKLGVRSRQELFLVYMKYLLSEQFRREFDAQTRKDDYLW